jgi:hypothetical protein
MTEAGCPIRGTAIQRIEKGDPPRTIGVDELFAFAAAFDLSVEDLLRPKELVDQERAQVLIETIERCERRMGDFAMETFNAISELVALGLEDQELYEYVVNHIESGDKGRYTLHLDSEDDDKVADLTLLRMVKANHDHWQGLQKAAFMWAAYKAGMWTEDDDRKADSLLRELRADMGRIVKGD